jgi:hypothetical protein
MTADKNDQVDAQKELEELLNNEDKRKKRSPIHRH